MPPRFWESVAHARSACQALIGRVDAPLTFGRSIIRLVLMLQAALAGLGRACWAKSAGERFDSNSLKIGINSKVAFKQMKKY